MFVDEKAIKFFTSDMILAKIHAEEDSLTAAKYHVNGYPTSILLNKSGVEIDRLVGYEPPEEYVQGFIDYSNGIGTLDDLLGQAAEAEGRALSLEIADKYKWRGESEDAVNWYAKVIAAGEPADSLSGEARMAEADMYRRNKDYDQALEAYKKVAAEFESYHGMDAVIYQAITYRRMADTATAIATFESFVEQFPESEDAEYAREQIEKLKNPPVESGE